MLILQGTQFQPNIYQGHKNKFIITTKWVYFFSYKPCITVSPLVINLYMFYLPLIQGNAPQAYEDLLNEMESFLLDELNARRRA